MPGHTSTQRGTDIYGQPLETDVCVIGGGPAGIVVAAELANAGARVTALEAGGRSYDHRQLHNLPRSAAGHVLGAQAATRGLSKGYPYYPLRMSRVRGVGGSTSALKAHGLRSRPLDAIDFEDRLGAGWPIDYDVFAEHLATAAHYCAVELPEGNQSPWNAELPTFGSARSNELRSVAFRHGTRGRFGRLGARAADHPLQTWLPNTTAVGFLTDATGHVTAVEARARSGASMLVEARAFIIATGGIDNARLLLAAPEVLEIMGPAGNNVGRFFMEHFHYVAGHIIPSSARVFDEMTHFFGDTDGQERWLTLSDTVVQRDRLTRTAYSAVPTYSGSLAPSVNALGRFARMFPYGPFDRELWMNEARTVLGGAGAIPGAMAERLRPSTARTHLAVAAMSEQSPNPDSRITLSTRRDRTGLLLPELDWRIARRDLESMQHSGQILGRAVIEAGLGEFVPSADFEHGRPPPLTGGWHHMGTTRMSAEAADGVVDQNCRVHGLENLYVAGSSVFPTSGFANPTLSLVALAVRLARHVASETM